MSVPGCRLPSEYTDSCASPPDALASSSVTLERVCAEESVLKLAASQRAPDALSTPVVELAMLLERSTARAGRGKQDSGDDRGDRRESFVDERLGEHGDVSV